MAQLRLLWACNSPREPLLIGNSRPHLLAQPPAHIPHSEKTNQEKQPAKRVRMGEELRNFFFEPVIPPCLFTDSAPCLDPGSPSKRSGYHQHEDNDQDPIGHRLFPLIIPPVNNHV